MGKYIALEYEHLYIGTISTEYDTVTTNKSEYRRRAYLGNKIACFSIDDSASSPSRFIEYNTVYHLCSPQNLFISPSVKMSRDLFRHSGYKIVHEKEKAEYIVIPTAKSNYPSFSFDFVAYRNKSLYVFSVNRKFYDKGSEEGREDAEHDFELIKDYFSAERGYVIYQDKLFFNRTLEILPNYQEYKDILLCDDEDELPLYIEDIRVPINYPVTLSVDTLTMWENYDRDLLPQAICNSNWSNYPFTLCAFLYTTHKYIGINQKNAQFKNVLNVIGYNIDDGLEGMMRGREIQPHDFNLLGDYILSKLGLPEDGGYIDADTYTERLPKFYKKMLRKYFLVKPLRLKEPLTFENISALIGSSY